MEVEIMEVEIKNGKVQMDHPTDRRTKEVETGLKQSNSNSNIESS